MWFIYAGIYVKLDFFFYVSVPKHFFFAVKSVVSLSDGSFDIIYAHVEPFFYNVDCYTL